MGLKISCQYQKYCGNLIDFRYEEVFFKNIFIFIFYICELSIYYVLGIALGVEGIGVYESQFLCLRSLEFSRNDRQMNI